MGLPEYEYSFCLVAYLYRLSEENLLAFEYLLLYSDAVTSLPAVPVLTFIVILVPFS